MFRFSATAQFVHCGGGTSSMVLRPARLDPTSCINIVGGPVFGLVVAMPKPSVDIGMLIVPPPQ